MSNEADTCRKWVTPRLQAAGWDNDPHSIAEQRSITDRRILPVGKSFTRKKNKRVDYLLKYRRDKPLAVVEAKAHYKEAADGMQQAKEPGHAQIELLPEHPPYFPKDDMSDRDLRFFTSEMIREKVLALYKQEIPYSTQVVVNSYLDEPEIVKIQADVIVMRESQKGIIIGKGGGALRQLGTEARKALEKFCDKKVFLDLKVKVDPDWRDDEKKLKRYGY